MYEKCFSFLLHSGFSGKNGVSGKFKAHFNSVQNFFSSTPIKKEGRDYAFHVRDYKGEAIKLLPFYMTGVLFTEL